MTSEAYNLLKQWMDYRELHGEKITGDSWLMRDLWQTTEMNYGAKFGLPTIPKRLTSLGIKSLLERAIKAQGLVKPLNKENNERRRECRHHILFRQPVGLSRILFHRPLMRRDISCCPLPSSRAHRFSMHVIPLE